MKYVVGKLGSMLGDDFRYRYTNPQCVEATSEEDAVKIYNDKYNSVLHKSFARCIGIMDKDNRLLIPNFHLKYPSAKHLRPATPGTYNHLVSRLLDEPQNFTDFSIYIPDYIQAVCPEDALIVYESLYKSQRFKAYVLGYLDENNTFIVPNILDYIK